MFDPKEIYGKISLREIIGDAPVRWRMDLKDWPCDETATIQLANERGDKEYVLIAPGCTVEGTITEVRRCVERLTGGGGRGF